eukprot:365001-Chlamydomonas_euryale.AAC.12
MYPEPSKILTEKQNWHFWAEPSVPGLPLSPMPMAHPTSAFLSVTLLSAFLLLAFPSVSFPECYPAQQIAVRSIHQHAAPAAWAAQQPRRLCVHAGAEVPCSGTGSTSTCLAPRVPG